MRSFPARLAAGAALCAAGVIPLSAAAMPVADLAAASQQASNVERVGWVCGPSGCWWQSDYAYSYYPAYYYRPAYVPRYYGYGPYYGPRVDGVWGLGGGWRRGW
jgi:hypothetical protein